MTLPLLLFLPLLATEALAGPHSILGRVVLEGEAPARPPLVASPGAEDQPDTDVCGVASAAAAGLIVDATGGVRDVAVFLESLDAELQQLPKPAPARLELVGCAMRPSAQALVIGQELEIVNLDPIGHRLRAVSEIEETLFEITLPLQNQLVRKRMKRAGIVQLRCDDGHSWSSATLVVQPHGYVTLTDSSGQFELPDIPPGSYSLVLWHDILGEKRQRVEVDEDDGPIRALEIPLRRE